MKIHAKTSQHGNVSIYVVPLNGNVSMYVVPLTLLRGFTQQYWASPCSGIHSVAVLASYPGLLTPAFVACSTNAGEGLVKLSHVV